MELTADRCRDRDFWRRLNPRLHLEGTDRQGRAAQIEREPDELAKAREMLLWDGYFVLHTVFDEREMERLSQAIVHLEEESIPTIFAFVYDDFWNLLPRLESILGRVFEPGFRVEANFWVWYVEADDAASGFRIHRDSYEPLLFENGQPQAVTLWFALTDAIPPQSCMYYLPASRDPNYVRNLRDPYTPPIEHIRAVPVSRGSVIGHCPNLLHCGSASSRYAAGPRISFCIEVRSCRAAASTSPSWRAGVVPSFEERLAVIAHMVEMYRHHTTYSDEFLQLARSLDTQALLWLPSVPAR